VNSRTLRSFAEFARVESHTKRTEGFADCNFNTKNTELVLALQCYEVATGIEYGHRQWAQLQLSPFAGRRRPPHPLVQESVLSS
jgi:hypothetical protein